MKQTAPGVTLIALRTERDQIQRRIRAINAALDLRVPLNGQARPKP